MLIVERAVDCIYSVILVVLQTKTLLSVRQTLLHKHNNNKQGGLIFCCLLFTSAIKIGWACGRYICIFSPSFLVTSAVLALFVIETFARLSGGPAAWAP